MDSSSDQQTPLSANPGGTRIRVLCVDDSALIRKLLTELLGQVPDIEVIGCARDPFDAREKIKALDPDVLTLDVEMPRMDGITFLENLMRLRPMPVVMVSTLTERGTDVTLRALSVGAVGFVPKPTMDVAKSLEDRLGALVWEIRKAAACSNDIRNANQRVGKPIPDGTGEYGEYVPDSKVSGENSSQLIAIGASTGGTEAIREVLGGIPPGGPGIVISQHIPVGFSASFARRMDKVTALHVAEAKDGMPIKDGHAYIAPGDHHLRVIPDGRGFRCKLDNGPRVNLHKPSVDVMFESVAAVAGARAVGVILTGMGRDGATGLRTMRSAGAPTIAQDQATSVVYGMPRAAVEEKAVDVVKPLGAIAREVTRLLRSNTQGSVAQAAGQ